MEKRKYTKIQVLEVEMESMHKGGKTHREIAEHCEAAEPKRLRMENQLLRDFLELAERGCGHA